VRRCLNEIAPPRQLNRYRDDFPRMTHKFKLRRLLRRIATVQGAIFLICLINFIVRGIEVDRLDREIRAYGAYAQHWYPGRIMLDPFLLLVAGALLLFNRWWALLISLLASARVIYSLGYLPWVSMHYAHDVPMFSSQAMEKLWHVIYKSNLEYPFQVGLGLIVFVCASILLTRVIIRRRAVAAAGG
jgi:hypothetical protein